jgi:hypothetical protein
MIHRLRSACGCAALMAVLALSVHAIAKPPDLPEDGTFELLPMPQEDRDITCPYLRQRKIDCPACPIADPEIGHGVLANLERLKQADNLLEMAKEWACVGCFSEAIECCARAAELCPGSPCAERAANAMLELALGIVTSPNGSEEAAEPPTSQTKP